MSRRRFRLVFLYILLLLPGIIYGAREAIQTNANSPVDWVDDHFRPRRDYDAFAEQFGAGDVVFLSWLGCWIDNPQLDELTAALRQDARFSDSSGSYFQRIDSGRAIFQELTQHSFGIGESEAKRRMRGSFLGPDGRTTCVIIGFTDRGLKNRRQLVPLIRSAAAHYGQVDGDSIHLAGPIIDGFEVDRASQATINRFAPLSSLLVFGICLYCFESLYAAVLVFGVSCLCQGLALAVLHFSGGEMTAVLIVLPSLVQVLSIAGGVHLVNYYLESKGKGDGRDCNHEIAIEAAVRAGWLPCVLSSVTTAIGLGSLAVSGLIAVREFGVYSAIGVLLTAASLLTLIPGILRWKPISVSSSRDHHHFVFSVPDACWRSLTGYLLRFGMVISLAGVAAMVGLGMGVSQLEASVRIETLFGPESRLVRDYRWIEEHVGPVVPIEVVVSFEEDAGSSEQPVDERNGSSADRGSPDERMRVLRAVREQLQQRPETEAVLSCLEWMPASSESLDANSMARYFAVASPLVARANYMVQDGGFEKWRFTSRVSAFGHQDYGVILESIRGELHGVLENQSATRFASVQLSGLMPLVHQIQVRLLEDLFASFLVAFLLISVVMTVVQAGILPGLLAMVPNVFPSLTLFGILGWLGIPIDIGSIMTASVAMGIAVDDTLHFLTFYQRQMDIGAGNTRAVLSAFRHCGRAMIQTTLICGVGLAIFGFSDFIPTARFAWMMVVLLAAALVGDLILLPALLLSPVGRLSRPQGKTEVGSEAC